MTHPQPLSPGRPSFYIADVEDPIEMSRLIGQARLIMQAMGKLLPQDCDPFMIHRVLDIACGPGGWALDLALAYPHMQVFGIDISEKVVAIAKKFAQGDGASNTFFRQMDARGPLDFPDQFFDVVNAQLLSSCMKQEQWPKLLQECLRITRPGGVIRFTEFEGGFSNSLAVGKVNLFFSQALYRAEMGFAPSGYGTGVTAMLAKFLSDAGLTAIQQQAFALEAGSHGTASAQGWRENLAVFFHTMSPFIVRTGIATEEELSLLGMQAMEEMKRTDYRALVYLLSAWGRRPPSHELKLAN